MKLGLKTSSMGDDLPRNGEFGKEAEDVESFDPRLTDVLAECRMEFLRYLQTRLGDRDEAEDVLQDFYVRVLTKAGQIRNSNSTVPWLRKVLKTVLADHFRRIAADRRAYQFMKADWLATSPVQENATYKEEDIDRITNVDIRKFLPAMKADYAEVLTRVDLAEQSREEAARDLEISTENLRVRLHRARRSLQARILYSQGEPIGMTSQERNTARVCRSHRCPAREQHAPTVETNRTAAL